MEKLVGPNFPKSNWHIGDWYRWFPVKVQWLDEDLDGTSTHFVLGLRLGQMKVKMLPSFPPPKFFSYQKNFKPAKLKILGPPYWSIYPEGIAWFSPGENGNKVAFRNLSALKRSVLPDGGFKGGTWQRLFDCWMKRETIRSFNKWYQKTMDGGSITKTMAKDMILYHVGDSRGIGGIGVQWIGEELGMFPKFHLTRELSPLKAQTVFELTYAPLESLTESVMPRERSEYLR